MPTYNVKFKKNDFKCNNLSAIDVRKILMPDNEIENIVSPQLSNNNDIFYYNALEFASLFTKQNNKLVLSDENRNFVANVSYKNLNQLNADSKIKKDLMFKNSNIADHMIALNKIKKDDGKNLYILTDTLNGYSKAHKMLTETLKNIDDNDPEFIVIKNVYSNGKNDCAINAIVNSEAIPKIVQSLKDSKAEVNQQSIAKEITKYRPTEIIELVRNIDVADGYIKYLNQNHDLLEEQRGFCEELKTKFKSSLPEIFKKFIENPTTFNSNRISTTTEEDIYNETLNELIKINNKNEKTQKEDTEDCLTMFYAKLKSLKEYNNNNNKSLNLLNLNDANNSQLVVSPENITFRKKLEEIR